MLGNLRDNGTLIADEDGNISMVGSAERYIKISTRGSSISVGRERVSSYNDTNSATTSNSASSRTSGSTMTECSGSASTFALKRSAIGWLSG